MLKFVFHCHVAHSELLFPALSCITVGGILLLLTNMQVNSDFFKKSFCIKIRFQTPFKSTMMNCICMAELCLCVSGRWATCLLLIAPPSSPCTTVPLTPPLWCFSSSRYSRVQPCLWSHYNTMFLQHLKYFTRFFFFYCVFY